MRSIKSKVFLLVTFISILLIGGVNAQVTCTPNQIVSSYLVGETNTSSISCSNSGNTSVQITTTGSYFTIDSSSIGQSPSTKTINIDFSVAPEGNHYGSIAFSDGSQNVPIFFEVLDVENIDPTSCQINPSLVSYTQQVQTGTKIPMPKITFNPVNCPSQLILTPSSVSVQGGVVTQGGQKPVFISSVESDGINIEIDTEDLSTQTYSSKLKITAFNKIFEIPFNIIVTGGTGGTGSFDVDNLPTCSLTATELNLNETYSLVCTNLVPDVSIVPIIDDFYVKGLSLDRELNQWTWDFKAKNIGVTSIKANFNYLGVPVGDPYNQEVKITPSGNSAIGGITLRFTFYQRDVKTPVENLTQGRTVIQVLDNTTGSIRDFTLYVNGLEALNKTLNLEAEKYYELRAVSQGYLDQIVNFTPSKSNLSFFITPEKEYYLIGDVVNFSSNENSTSFVVGGVTITNPYTFNSEGNVTIFSEEGGVITSNRTVIVRKLITIVGLPNIDYEDWEKGDKIVFDISEEVDWSIKLKDEEISNGSGKRVNFTITDNGLLKILSGENLIYSVVVKEEGAWYLPWSHENGWVEWGMYLLYLAIIIFIIWFFKFRNKSSPSQGDEGFVRMG